MFTGAFQRFLIVVLTTFWLCPDGGSQTQVNYLQPGFDCFSANLFKVNEDTMMLFGMTGRPGNQSTAYAYIEYLGSDGEHIGTRKLTELLNSHLDEFKILPLTNGKIVTIPVIHSCDYYPGIKVGMTDPSFGYQWIADTYMHYDKDFFVAQIGLNAFCLFNDSREQCFDLDGNVYWPIDPPWNIGPKIPYHHGFLASDGSVLYLLDSTFTPDHAIWLKQPIRDFTVSDTFGLIALTTDSVFVIDSSLSITLSAPAEIINPKFVTSANNSICIGNETTVLRLDSSLTLLETWTLPGFVRITDMHSNNNTVFIAGIDISNPMHTAALCITTPVDSFNLNMEEDVQITSIRIDGQAKYKHVGQDGESIYSVDYGPVFCTLRNNGPDTVRSVAIRHQREVVSWICGNSTWRYIWYLQALSLPPNDSIEVFIDTMQFCCVKNPFADLCFWSSGPNAHPDIESANDWYCHTPDIISGTTSSGIKSELMTIYPNPASDVIHVSFRDPVPTGVSYEYYLMNMFGQVVINGTWSSKDDFQIRIGMAPSGIYVLSIINTHAPVDRIQTLITRS